MTVQDAIHSDGAPDAAATQPNPAGRLSGEPQPDAALATASPREEARACGIACGIELAETLDDLEPWEAFVRRVPISFARRHGVMGFTRGEEGSDEFTLALAGLESWEQVDVLGRYLGRFAEPLLAPSQAVQAAINKAYQQQTGQADAMLQSLSREQVLEEVSGLASREDLLDVASRAPVIKLVNLMLFEAVQSGASDVHVQPYENRLVVRLRIDGVLYNIFELPKHLQEEVVSRVKVMGRMNIAEKRIAQDGRATAQVGDRVIDLRIASLPSSFGERVVVRLLDKSARLYRLPEIGMPPDTLVRFRKLIAREHGLLLVTGPTGSGKSTTLYSSLQELDCERHNILTLEDPIEYQLEGISQTQVSDRKGMTFASGLRSVLRQDPDIIMVGEIRDAETATMAIQSALTGHLVFSTLHTNDAASAVTRLLDLGIEPYLAASSVIGVLAQRLVRTLCPHCSEPATPSAAELAWLGTEAGTDHGRTNSLRRSRGCDACRHSGYRGRIGIFELLAMDDRIRQLVHQQAPAGRIKAAAIKGGMRTLRDDGVEKVLAGRTTVAEVERVTAQDAAGEEAAEA